jgi:hypothetical protein
MEPARTLRHTAARWNRLHGVPADEVAQQLGHRKLGMTGVYTEYDPEYLRAACAALDGLLLAVLPKNYPVGGGGHRKNADASTASCRSSVVEHSLGKGEVVCSIHTGSTNRIRFPSSVSLCSGLAEASGTHHEQRMNTAPWLTQV